MNNYAQILLKPSNRLPLFAIVNVSAITSAILFYQYEQPKYYSYIFVTLVIVTLPF